MRLICIRHMRCDDYEGVTYAVALDAKTDDDVSNDVEAARAEHLQAIEAFRKASPPPPFACSGINDYPDDMTIAEAKRAHDAVEAARWDYSALERKAKQSFGTRLQSKGYVLLQDLNDGENDGPLAELITGMLFVEVYWGHYHGYDFDTSTTDTDCVPGKDEIAKINPVRVRAIKAARVDTI